MAQYIESEAVNKLLQKEIERTWHRVWGSVIWELYHKISQIPTADVVEVVRCGQCKHATEDIMVEGVCYCHKIQQGMFVDGFCNYGERRSGNERHFMVDSYKY